MYKTFSVDSLSQELRKRSLREGWALHMGFSGFSSVFLAQAQLTQTICSICSYFSLVMLRGLGRTCPLFPVLFGAIELRTKVSWRSLLALMGQLLLGDELCPVILTL